MAKKKIKKAPKIVTPKKVIDVEKVKVTEVSSLDTRVAVLETRLDALITALKSSKGLKGI